MAYWLDRQEKQKDAIAKKTEREIQKQLKKYYATAMKKTIEDFEATYDKLMATMEDGREPTPADLYKLDKYWQTQSQLKNEMQKLGDKEIALLSREFEEQWKAVYEASALPSELGFSTLNTQGARTMINTSWLPDGKNFSKRIWTNTEKLTETLNEHLINCIVTGKDSRELKQLLQERFDVSYNSANRLVKTEITHIQTRAAAQRYQDYGLTYYEFLGRDEHDIGCDCKRLNGKKILFSEMVEGKNAPPLHPHCRCAIIPVVDNESEEIIMKKENKKQLYCKSCRKPIERGSQCNDCQFKEQLKMWKKEGVTEDNLELMKAYYEQTGNQYVQPWDVGKKHKIKCGSCGKEFRSEFKQGSKRGYCQTCRKKWKDDKEYVKKTCTECGRNFFRGKYDTKKTMCDACYTEYRRKYKAEKERERRAKNKKK